jgi:hypothetical protein
MYEDVYIEPAGDVGAGALVGGFVWILFLAVYLYFAFMQFRMATNKTGHANIAWWAFIPILNTFLLIKMSGKPMWWFILLLIPIVNVVAFFILWMETAKACSQSPVWGFLMLLPFINFVAAFVLAYSSRALPSETPERKQENQPVQTG